MTEAGPELPFYRDTLGCVHCGLCLPACPTYQELGDETESPRGRILLSRALAEGRIADGARIASHFDRCLGCLACESACPSGVRYRHVLEGTRAELNQRAPERGVRARLRKLLLSQVVARPRRLRWAFAALGLAERTGLRRLAQRLGLIPQLTERLLPAVPPRQQRLPLVGAFPPPGVTRGRVALFTGCVMEQAFGEINRKTLALLQANGFHVDVVTDQGCCGALHLHDGQLELARRLAQRNVDAFRGADVIVTNSAGCGAALRDYGHLLGSAVAADFAGRCRDVCEFLAEQGLSATPAPFPHRVAYDDPCHLCHGQGVRTPPRALLRTVPGIQLVDHPSAETCCGSAGIYNLLQPELASAIGADKAGQLRATGAEVVITGNPGCIMQIRAHLSGTGMRVLHPVEVLLPESG
ncbi:MAG: (Fe-S)-binding protein [Planctomycetes bacterium]|nr:(Fe-S)-binding protein [Planctomycetota bacterium]MCB9868895.1 (Fe-S)-binding protein [Planctomycetota bacterium]